MVKITHFIGRRNVHDKSSLHIISDSLWSLGTLTQLWVLLTWKAKFNFFFFFFCSISFLFICFRHCKVYMPIPNSQSIPYPLNALLRTFLKDHKKMKINIRQNEKKLKVMWKDSESEVTQLCPTLCDHRDHMDCIRLLHPWDFPGKSTGVDCHFLLQGIFPTQGSKPGLLHCRQMLYHLSHQGSPHSQISK